MGDTFREEESAHQLDREPILLYICADAAVLEVAEFAVADLIGEVVVGVGQTAVALAWHEACFLPDPVEVKAVVGAAAAEFVAAVVEVANSGWAVPSVLIQVVSADQEEDLVAAAAAASVAVGGSGRVKAPSRGPRGRWAGCR